MQESYTRAMVVVRRLEGADARELRRELAFVADLANLVGEGEPGVLAVSPRVRHHLFRAHSVLV